MLHIFLVILKIIGIILLVLLGIIVFLTLLLLFVPIRYQIDGKIYETEDNEGYKHEYETFGKASFLGVIMRADFKYKEQLSWKLKVCGITVMSDVSGAVDNETQSYTDDDKNEEGLNSAESENEAPDTEMSSHKNPGYIEKNDNLSDENVRNTEVLPDENSGNAEILSADTDNDGFGHGDTASEQDNEPVKTKKTRKRKTSFKTKISDIFTKIKKSLADIKKTIIKIKNAVAVFKELLENEKFKSSFMFIWDKIKFVIKKIAPHIKRGYVEFGTEDPALTGQITGAACAVRGIYGFNIDFLPDFEADRTYVNAEVKMKGKIRLGHFVKLVYYYLFSKEFKYFKHMLEKTRRKL